MKSISLSVVVKVDGMVIDAINTTNNAIIFAILMHSVDLTSAVSSMVIIDQPVYVPMIGLVLLVI
jgi:hypothetical protein